MIQYMHLLMPVRHRLRRLFLKLLIDDPGALEAPLPGAQAWKLDNMPELELLCVTFPTTNKSSEAGTIDLSACRGNSTYITPIPDSIDPEKQRWQIGASVHWVQLDVRIRARECTGTLYESAKSLISANVVR